MKPNERDKKIAVLIDAENAQKDLLPKVMNELSTYGTIIVKKAYGDWSSQRLSKWKDTVNELAIDPVQRFAYTAGKNSSDISMVIDAMDLLYSNRFDTFALVSSDSDFTQLATRLCSSEMFVFGFGEEKTPVAFRNACNDFVLTSYLADTEDEVECKGNEQASKNRPTKKELRCDTKLVRILRGAVESCSDDSGWAPLSSCGTLIKRQSSDFSHKKYGFSTLSGLFKEIDLFDHKTRNSTAFVKDKRFA